MSVTLRGRLEVTVQEEGIVREARGGRTFGGANQETDLNEVGNFVKAKLIEIAQITLKEELLKGFDKEYITSVDSKVGKRLEDVKPFGKIEYTARVEASDILNFIYKSLINRSAIDRGTYVDLNYVFVNRTLVAKNESELKAYIAKGTKYKSGDVIRFVNMAPYAGWLERRGISAGGRKSPRKVKSKDKSNRRPDGVFAANGTYFLTSRSVIRKYKFNSRIEFQWISGSQLDFSLAPSADKRGRTFRRISVGSKGSKGRQYAYPTIVIFVSSEGVL
jgi:hypothetical protein